MSEPVAALLITLTGLIMLGVYAYIGGGFHKCGRNLRDTFKPVRHPHVVFAAKAQARFDTDAVLKGYASGGGWRQLNLAELTAEQIKLATDVYQTEVERITEGQVRADANFAQLDEISERTTKALRRHQTILKELRAETTARRSS